MEGSMRAERVLITGGAGFIGCHLAARLIQLGKRVVILDNLSRPGAERNLQWLRERHGHTLTFVHGDLRRETDVEEALAGAEVVYHLAAQTAVTRSLLDPRRDFEDNLLGTFNVLEAARRSPRRPIVVYASTNKVYGALANVAVVELETRYAFASCSQGIDERQPLDFHSPYGCSKGAADQYVRDYYRTYGLPTVVFRQSCIYGPRQMGVEDQGWVAWFVLAALTGQPITIYGDGKQVRDLLYIDDLVEAYLLAVEHIEVTQGQVYNIGGGMQNTLSVWWELRPLLEELLEQRLAEPAFAPWRPGDQRIFVADTSKARREFGWAPRVPVREGLLRLVEWAREQAHTPAAV
jgi:CDP-paratose 2-epimerase